MNKARKTTFQERITIVKDCLENGSNYGETAITEYPMSAISRYIRG